MAKDGELSVVTMDGGPNLLYFVLCATISCDTGWRVQFFALSIFDLFRSKRPEKQPKNHHKANKLHEIEMIENITPRDIGGGWKVTRQ